jgi:hypothetical protein
MYLEYNQVTLIAVNMPILLSSILTASMDGVFLYKVTYNLFSNLCGLPFFFSYFTLLLQHDPHTFTNYSIKSTTIGHTIKMVARPTKAMREHIIKL